MIFETKRLIVRKLEMSDLPSFHKMESNPNVLKYAIGKVKSLLEDEKELQELINKYNKPNNDFWIYVIELKVDKQFVGTVALVKDEVDDEIGYRFLEEYWGLGFGSEICEALIQYAKKIHLPKLVGYVVDENIASMKILEKSGFKRMKSFINDENQIEFKYEINL